MRRNLLIFGLCAALGACSNSGGTQVTSTAAPTAAAADTIGASPPASDATSTPGTDAPVVPPGAVDPCAAVTTDEVAAAFGGTVAPGVLNPDNDGCDYEITGQTKTGDSGILTQVSIGLKSQYISYDEIKVVFPEAEKIDGIGQEAWYVSAAHQLHIDLGGRELLISGVFPGDEAAIKAEVIAFAQTVIGKL